MFGFSSLSFASIYIFLLPITGYRAVTEMMSEIHKAATGPDVCMGIQHILIKVE
jgi:hypothetical protein